MLFLVCCPKYANKIIVKLTDKIVPNEYLCPNPKQYPNNLYDTTNIIV